MRRFVKVVLAVLALAATAVAAPQVDALVGGADPPTTQAVPVTPRDTGAGLTETTFVPIAPCRVYDTRQGAGQTPIGAGNFRILKVRGPEDFAGQFAAQGGKAGGCGIPPTATAVEATITAVSAAGTGFLRAWPSGQPEPAAAFLNYIRGFNATNTGAIDICDVGCGLASDMRIRALNAATHVAVDVQGYYQKPMGAIVNSAGTAVVSSRVVSSVRSSTGQYRVQFDRTIDQCVATATADGTTGIGWATVSPDSADNTKVFVAVFDQNGTLANRAFHITVRC